MTESLESAIREALHNYRCAHTVASAEAEDDFDMEGVELLTLFEQSGYSPNMAASELEELIEYLREQLDARLLYSADELDTTRAEILEEAAGVADRWEGYYPTNLFPEPPPGEHGKTVDSCSARAARHVAACIAKDIRELRAQPEETPLRPTIKQWEEAQARIRQLELRQEWIDDVPPAAHPDDERPWAARYLDYRNEATRLTEEIMTVRGLIAAACPAEALEILDQIELNAGYVDDVKRRRGE